MRLLPCSGANGAGKTTTLRTISGLQPVADGLILTAMISPARAENSWVWGSPMCPRSRQLFRSMSVYDNLELGGYLIFKHYGRKQLKSDIEEIFVRFPILRRRNSMPAP
ncbi:MAG: ATP-binding cassette domain-containing protein [Desulfobacterales bacterium]